MIDLPDFRSTEEAVQFGRFITRDQYVFLKGARTALCREYGNEPDLQKKLFIAVKIQLIRECLDMASDLVLASLPKFAERNGVQVDTATAVSPNQGELRQEDAHETSLGNSTSDVVEVGHL